MIALGADHGGFRLKEAIRKYLDEQHIAYEDFGTYSEESVDYGPIAAKVAHFVADGKAEKGFLCCGTGIGISMAANKVKGIRAAVVTNDFCAEMTRRHNDANMMAMGAGFTGKNMAERMVEVFLSTDFEGGRHARRVDKMMAIEG